MKKHSTIKACCSYILSQITSVDHAACACAALKPVPQPPSIATTARGDLQELAAWMNHDHVIY